MKSLHEFVTWTLSHLARSRASKLILLMLIVVAAAAAFTLMMPLQENLRVLLFVFGSLGLFAVAGLYFAYRTVGFARRLAAESAALRESVTEAAEDLKRIERLRAVDRAYAASEVRYAADSVEQKLESGLQALDQRFSEVNDLREELRQLQHALGAVQAIAARTAAQGDSVDVRLSTATSSIDRLHAVWKSDADQRRNEAAAASERQARDSAVLQSLTKENTRLMEAIEDLRRRNAQSENRIDKLAELLDTLAAGVDASAGKLSELTEAHAGVAGLAQSVSNSQATDRAVLARLQREIVVMAEVHASASERARILGEQAAEAIRALHELTSRQGQFDRNLAGVMSDMATMHQRLGGLDSKLFELRETIEAEGELRHGEVSRKLQQIELASQKQAGDMAMWLSAADQRYELLSKEFAAEKAEGKRHHAEITSKLQQIELAGQKQAEDTALRLSTVDQRHKAFGGELAAEKAEGKRRYDEIASELRQMRAESQQTAKMTGALEQRQTMLEGKLGAAMSEIAGSAARINQIVDGVAAISVEASRLASVAAELDARHEQLAGAVRETRQELAKVAAAAADGEARLAAIDMQAGETASGLKDVADATTVRFMQLQDRLEGIAASMEAAVVAGEQTASAVSMAIQQIAGMQERVAAGDAVHDRLETHVRSLSEQVETNSALATRTATRQAEIASELGVVTGRLDSVVHLADGLGDALSTLQAKTEALHQDQARSVSVLAGRLDLMMADLGAVRDTLEQSRSDILVRLAGLDSRVEKDVGGDRIGAIEADIAHVVRLVDDAEAAFADEISRLAATASKLSEDVALVRKQAAEGSSELEGRLNAIQKTLADSINSSIEGRLSGVERDVAQVSRLLNDSEVATVAELTQLSAALLQIKDDVQNAVIRDAGASRDAGDLIEQLRLQLARAASQIEGAVRDTEQALGDLGRNKYPAISRQRTAKASDAKKGERPKSVAKSPPSRAAPARARKTRKRR